MRPSAVRLTRKERTIRSTVAVRRSGRPTVTPGGSESRTDSFERGALGVVEPFGKDEVDPVEESLAAEELLRRGDVGEDDRPGGRAGGPFEAQDPGHAEPPDGAAGEDAELRALR